MKYNRRGGRVVPGYVSEAASLLTDAMREAGVCEADRRRFLTWTVGKMWNEYRNERMNQRIDAEQQIKSLGIRLANGTVGKPYHQVLTLPAGVVSNVRVESADGNGLETLGLKFDYDAASGEGILCGEPRQSCDLKLRLIYDTVEGEPASELILPLVINCNPRDLWKNIATEPDIEFPKEDEEKHYIFVEAGPDGHERKDIVAASKRGRSHAQEGKPRDDHFGVYYCTESGWYIMAVADGAGSAKFSRKGSEVTCDTVVEHCKSLLLDNPEFEAAIRDYEADRENNEKRTAATKFVIDIVYNGAMKAHDAIKKVAMATDGSLLKDFATTLMFAVCKKYEFGWFIASFWVGDGAMALLDINNKSVKLLGTPDEGEYSGQTRFLTMPEIFRDPEVAIKRLRMAIVPDFTALLLMSDGVSDPMFESDSNLNDFYRWESFYNRLRQGFPEDGIGGVALSHNDKSAQDQLLRWLDFWSPGNHDDRTIAILY